MTKEQRIKEQEDFTRSKFESGLPRSVGDMQRWAKWHDEAIGEIESEYK